VYEYSWNARFMGCAQYFNRVAIVRMDAAVAEQRD
jgi:hypothetical protein